MNAPVSEDVMAMKISQLREGNLGRFVSHEAGMPVCSSAAWKPDLGRGAEAWAALAATVDEAGDGAGAEADDEDDGGEVSVLMRNRAERAIIISWTHRRSSFLAGFQIIIISGLGIMSPIVHLPISITVRVCISIANIC
jgi:hypothetical protein